VPGERFAIKVLEEALRPDAFALLREEVRKTRKLRHPNIVDVHSLNVDGQKLYVLMEYLEGESLDKLLDEEFGRGMPFRHAWPIIEDVGAAAERNHRTEFGKYRGSEQRVDAPEHPHRHVQPGVRQQRGDLARRVEDPAADRRADYNQNCKYFAQHPQEAARCRRLAHLEGYRVNRYLFYRLWTAAAPDSVRARDGDVFET